MNQFIKIVFLIYSMSIFGQNDINKLDSNGKKVGLWKGVYEESKRPRYEGTFDHDKEVGLFQFFDDSKASNIVATAGAIDYNYYSAPYDTYFAYPGTTTTATNCIKTTRTPATTTTTTSATTTATATTLQLQHYKNITWTNCLSLICAEPPCTL